MRHLCEVVSSRSTAREVGEFFAPLGRDSRLVFESRVRSFLASLNCKKSQVCTAAAAAVMLLAVLVHRDYYQVLILIISIQYQYRNLQRTWYVRVFIASFGVIISVSKPLADGSRSSRCLCAPRLPSPTVRSRGLSRAGGTSCAPHLTLLPPFFLSPTEFLCCCVFCHLAESSVRCIDAPFVLPCPSTLLIPRSRVVPTSLRETCCSALASRNIYKCSRAPVTSK